jgi:hypothetical protein
MNPHSPFELDKMRKGGFWISIGSRLTTGPLLRVAGQRDTAEALSDKPRLSKYTEIEILGLHGAPSTFILTSRLISKQQLLAGYTLSGLPLLIGIRQASKGNILILGQSRSGKTSLGAELGGQIARHGFPLLWLGLKCLDPGPIAHLWTGTKAQTKLNSRGQLVSSPFRHFTNQPNARTGAFNYFAQRGLNLPPWLRASNLLGAFGMGGGEADPARRFFTASAQQLLQQIPDWGASFRELNSILDKRSLDRDTRYSVSGALHEIAQQAAIFHANLPSDHPANIDFGQMLLQGGAIYFDACYQDVGPVSTASAGLAAQMFIFAKRRVDPENKLIAFLVIDEAQLFPRSLLKQMVEQCAGSNIRLIVICHNLDQFGDDVESLSMMQVRFIYGAVPGGSTAEHIQHLFGTRKELEFSISIGAGIGTSITTTEGSGGNSIALGSSSNQQSSISFTARDNLCWNPNDTLELNHDPARFIVQVSPGAELAHWGPKAIVGQRAGYLLSLDETNTLASEALSQQEFTVQPGETAKVLIGEKSTLSNPERTEWLRIMAQSAETIRKTL